MLEILSTNRELLILISGFLIIAIAANQIASVFQKMRLPLITGLIFTGIIAGPHIIGLVPVSAKVNLQFINEIALAFIAFAAGSELYLSELRSKIRIIKVHSIMQSVVGFLTGSLLVYFLTGYMDFAAGLSFEHRLSIAMLSGVLFLAPSPASVIAVANELRARGPFTKTILGITMSKDFIVVILFAVVLSISKSISNGYALGVGDFLTILFELAFSFVVAYGVGKLLHLILKIGKRKWLKMLLILVLGLLNYTFSHYFKDFSSELIGHEIYLEPLLICLIGSFYITNYTKYRPEFLRLLKDMAPYVYVFFFTLTGASMNLTVISQVWVITLILFAIRLVTLILGALSGHFITKDPVENIRVGWMPYVAQAGVALGLVTVVGREFPTWGNDFATISISVIIINQIIGPPLIAYAITFLGENRSKGSGYEDDGIKDAIIFGFESQSVALANQLRDNGWEVQIATRLQEGSIDEPEGIKIFYGLKEFDKAEFDAMEAHKTEAIVTMLSDEENLKICETAFHHFGTRDLIVRLNHRYNYDKFLSLEAKIVDPSTAIVSLLDHFVRSPQATSLLLGMAKGQDSRDIEINNSDIHGLPLRDLRLPGDVIILSIIRGGQTIITHGYTRLRIKDIVTVVGSIKSLDQVQLKFEK